MDNPGKYGKAPFNVVVIHGGPCAPGEVTPVARKSSEKFGIIEFQPDIFQSVWKEAEELRKSGELLKSGHEIQCPVIAIHGDYDPHPVKGVEEPLSRTLRDFKLLKLDKCGHCPWNERNAKDKFYSILEKELILLRVPLRRTRR